MMTRAEKLFNMRAQVAKAASDIDHGDTYGACLTLGDALSAVLEFLEEELPEKSPIHGPDPKAVDAMLERERAIHPVGERVKEAEPTKLKVKK
jgi:hypothetical protein